MTTRMACVMMQKDEALLLRPWLLYHGLLLGFENLFVFDNGSAPAVQDILREFAGLGVNVDFNRAAPADFTAKGEIIGAQIRQFRAARRYDLVIPLDCDEFLSLAGPDCAGAAVLAELRRIAAGRNIARTESCYVNRPGFIDEFWLAEHRKSIVPVAGFEGIDHGFHAARPRPEGGYAGTSLCYIHMHCKPFAAFQAGVADKLRNQVDVNDAAALARRNYTGAHLAEYPGMSAAEYYAGGLRNRGPFLRYEGLPRLFQAMPGCAGLSAAWEAGRRQGPRAPLLHNAALAAMAAGRHHDAAALWADYRQLCPDDPDGYDYAAAACRICGDDAGLAAILDAATVKFPAYRTFVTASPQAAPPDTE